MYHVLSFWIRRIYRYAILSYKRSFSATCICKLQPQCRKCLSTELKLHPPVWNYILSEVKAELQLSDHEILCGGVHVLIHSQCRSCWHGFIIIFRVNANKEFAIVRWLSKNDHHKHITVTHQTDKSGLVTCKQRQHLNNSGTKCWLCSRNYVVNLLEGATCTISIPYIYICILYLYFIWHVILRIPVQSVFLSMSKCIFIRKKGTISRRIFPAENC